MSRSTKKSEFSYIGVSIGGNLNVQKKVLLAAKNETKLFLAFRRHSKWCLPYFPIIPWDHSAFVLTCVYSSVTTPSPSIVFVTIFVHLLHKVFLSVSITLWFSLELFSSFLTFVTCHNISCR